MKKTFPLKHEKKNQQRHVEAIKYEIKKYIARERRKDVPDGFDDWAFQCKIGANEAEAIEVHSSKINESIDLLVEQNNPSFFLMVLAEPRKKKPKAKSET